MSIDYDRLRGLADTASPAPWRTDEHPYMDGQNVYDAEGFKVAQHLSGFNAELAALAPDMARELLRLRDGVENLREMCLLERDAAFNESPMRAGEVTAFNICAENLTDLLEGDYE